MPLLSKNTGGSGDFDPVPAGSYVARCISVVDFGLQETKWEPKSQVYLGFEVAAVRVEWTDKDDKHHEGPALIGQRFTNSLNEKANLRKALESWRGRAFTEKQLEGWDLFNVLDAPCMISVVHNTSADGTKTYANIAAIMRCPKGTEVPDREGELLKYSPHDDSTIGNLAKLPEWMSKKIEQGAALAMQGTAESQDQSMPALGDQYDEYDQSIPF